MSNEGGIPADPNTEGGNTADTKESPLYLLGILLPGNDDAVKSTILNRWVSNILSLHAGNTTKHFQVALFGPESPVMLDTLQRLIGDEKAGEIFGFNAQDHCFPETATLEQQLEQLVNISVMYRFAQSTLLSQGTIPLSIQQPKANEVIKAIHFLANPNTLEAIGQQLPLAVAQVGQKGNLYGGALDGVTIFYGNEEEGGVFGEAPTAPVVPEPQVEPGIESQEPPPEQAGTKYSCDGCGALYDQLTQHGCAGCGGDSFTVVIITPPPPSAPAPPVAALDLAAPVVPEPEEWQQATSSEEPPAAEQPETEAVTSCLICHHDNEPGAKYCARCGSGLQPTPDQMVECEVCDHLNPPGAKFCSNCGHQLGTVPVTPSAPEPPVEEPPQTPTPEPPAATAAPQDQAPPQQKKGVLARLMGPAPGK